MAIVGPPQGGRVEQRGSSIIVADRTHPTHDRWFLSRYLTREAIQTIQQMGNRNNTAVTEEWAISLALHFYESPLSVTHDSSKERPPELDPGRINALRYAFYVLAYPAMKSEEQRSVRQELESTARKQEDEITDPKRRSVVLIPGLPPIVRVLPETARDLQLLWQSLKLPEPADAVARSILEETPFESTRFIRLPLPVVRH